jgi:thioredoxin reductase
LNCSPKIFEYQLPINNSTKEEDKFLVIGTGFCGLAICGALKRNGILFEAVEKNNEIGGNWFCGVYESVHIISSRRTTEYRDYPMPDHYPDFPSAQEMLAYLKSYCDDHLKIRDLIQFHTTADKIEHLNDSYRVTITNIQTNKTITKIYKGVIIANGHHWDMRIPKYPHQEEYTGTIIHSKNYKKPDQLVGKRVLVIGGGNSACDIATEAARFAEESHLSLRRGYWFLPRCTGGKPSVELTKAWMPIWLQRLMVRFVLNLSIGSYSDYGLPEPDHSLFEHHPTVNTTILDNLKLGLIKPHGDIEQFVPGTNQIKLLDTKEKKHSKTVEIDMVVFCTGYHTSIPLLDGHVDYQNDNETHYPNIIRRNYIKDRPHLYVAGLGQVRYGAGSLYTSEAELIAKSILAQNKMKHPVANVWKTLTSSRNKLRTNEKSPDILLDPHSSWKEKRVEALLVTYLFPLLDRFLVV